MKRRKIGGKVAVPAFSFQFSVFSPRERIFGNRCAEGETRIGPRYMRIKNRRAVYGGENRRQLISKGGRFSVVRQTTRPRSPQGEAIGRKWTQTASAGPGFALVCGTWLKMAANKYDKASGDRFKALIAERNTRSQSRIILAPSERNIRRARGLRGQS